ncbi:cyclic nucleotide-binding protein [Ectothiorhodospira haloalkaliphila]|uniref:Flagellar secretion chaperone FliS n=1 Tax=Ectothiorhodospira haloalkaliphila TaxID=421628 RepID=W8KJV3_9GAMM|nr:flagellar export chaperone FliS [Ectothiorhodospira haloalkaliphila]AHK79443.1 cyclic nucleotide-binding protein [Ectothiorhodospira haloalkaliphila]
MTSPHTPTGVDRYRQVDADSTAFSDRCRLIQMLFDGGVERLAQARAAVMHGDRAARIRLIGKAFDIIAGLRSALNLERGGEIARNLDDLYDYMQRRLVMANSREDVAIIDEVLHLLTEIREGWKSIPPEVREDPSAHVELSGSAGKVVE